MTAKVAFVVSKFPCYDEAFILREIYAISREIEVMIFSLKKSTEKTIHDDARELLQKTLYVPYFFSWRVLRANIEVFLKSPLRFLRAFFRLVSGNVSSPEFLLKNLAFFPKAVYLARWIRREGVTHIHAYWATYPASMALVASDVTGIPFSFTGHAHDIYLDTTHLKKKMQKAAFVSTCTRQNKDYLSKLVPDLFEEKILVNYHGLNLEDFEVNGKKRNAVFQILSVGTLHFYKGFNYLLQTLAVLKQKGLEFHCTIIGGGPLWTDLQRHIQLLGLGDEVTMTGPLKQAQVISYYKRSDLFILMAQPEWHWGIPNVLVEALAAKTPVITTHFGSVEELVRDGRTGLIVPPKDPGALARAIEKFYFDDSFRRGLAEAGHRLVASEFDLHKNIRRLRERLEHEKTFALVA